MQRIDLRRLVTKLFAEPAINLNFVPQDSHNGEQAECHINEDLASMRYTPVFFVESDPPDIAQESNR